MGMREDSVTRRCWEQVYQWAKKEVEERVILAVASTLCQYRNNSILMP